jgi:Domain of unknown function (DUF4397)
MKRFIAVGAAALVAMFAVPAAAGAQTAPAATIMLLHGIPGTPVDVVVDGKVVVPNFEPGKMQDLSSFAGKTLKNLEVRLAGKTDVAIGPVAEFPVPATGNYTVVAHLDAAGKPALNAFKNDTSALEAGKGRLTVRHAAAAPAVDIVLGSARPFTNLANGKEGSAVLAAGSIAGAKVAPTGKDPIADVPTVDLKAGTNLIVYAVGSLEAKTFTFYTQTITGLGGTPTKVNTGNSTLPTKSTSDALLAGAAALAMFGLAGGVIARRRIRG